MFEILNLGHWDLFEPALARLDWHKPSSVLEYQVEAINAVGVNSVWARDLFFGAWNFHNYDKQVTLFIPVKQFFMMWPCPSPKPLPESPTPENQSVRCRHRQFHSRTQKKPDPLPVFCPFAMFLKPHPCQN